MPQNARLYNKQLRETEAIEARLIKDPYSLTTGFDTELIERAYRHKLHLAQQLKLHQEFLNENNDLN